MRKYFLTGLALLLPLAITCMIVMFILNLLTNPFAHYIEHWLNSHEWFIQISHKTLHHIVQIFILLILFLFTLLLGFFTRIFFIKSIIRLADYFLNKVPIVNKIYKTTKDIAKTLFSPNTSTFKQVVMVPFPQPGKFCVGLVTGLAPNSCSRIKGEQLTTVLVPTAPHPISGYLLLFKEKDIIHLDMSVEDAVKMTVSCGIVHPPSRH